MKIKWYHVLFFLYVAGMLSLLIFMRPPYHGPLSYGEYLQAYLNLTPFDTVQAMAWMTVHGTAKGIAFAWRNLLANVIFFIPLGIYLPVLCKALRRWWVCLLTVIGVILCVEFTQLFATLGSADVDDLILNTIGAMLGYLGWRLVSRHQKRKEEIR